MDAPMQLPCGWNDPTRKCSSRNGGVREGPAIFFGGEGEGKSGGTVLSPGTSRNLREVGDAPICIDPPSIKSLQAKVP